MNTSIYIPLAIIALTNTFQTIQQYELLEAVYTQMTSLGLQGKTFPNKKSNSTNDLCQQQKKWHFIKFFAIIIISAILLNYFLFN